MTKRGTWTHPVKEPTEVQCWNCDQLTENSDGLCNWCVEEQTLGHVQVRYDLRGFRTKGIQSGNKHYDNYGPGVKRFGFRRGRRRGRPEETLPSNKVQPEKGLR